MGRNVSICIIIILSCTSIQQQLFCQENSSQTQALSPLNETDTSEPVTGVTPENPATEEVPQTPVSSRQKHAKEEFDRFQSDNFKKGIKYFFEKKYEMAQFLFQQELEQNPENYFAYSYLADIFLYKKRYDEAITLYKRALDLDPQNAENHFRLGQAYYYKDLGNLSVEHFKKAYQLNPQLKYAQYHIGLTYLIVLRDKEQTIEYWQNYLALAPEDPQYESIRRAVELLKNPNFVLPQVGSDVPLEEALHLGGHVLEQTERTDNQDLSAEHEEMKTLDSTAEIDRDDDL